MQLIGISVARRQISRPSAWLVRGLFLTFFLGVLWIGDAIVLSASICRSFFKGPLALALGMHGCEATEVTYIIA